MWGRVFNLITHLADSACTQHPTCFETDTVYELDNSHIDRNVRPKRLLSMSVLSNLTSVIF